MNTNTQIMSISKTLVDPKRCLIDTEDQQSQQQKADQQCVKIFALENYLDQLSDEVHGLLNVIRRIEVQAFLVLSFYQLSRSSVAAHPKYSAFRSHLKGASGDIDFQIFRPVIGYDRATTIHQPDIPITANLLALQFFQFQLDGGE